MKLIGKARNKAGEAQSFIHRGLWEKDLDELPRLKAWLYHDLRVLYLVVRGFVNDRCTMRAANLAFSTILSIVPLLAVVFAVASGFGAEQKIRPVITEYLIPKGLQSHSIDGSTGEDSGPVNAFIETAVDNALNYYKTGVNQKALGGVGLLILLYVVIRIMGLIEKTLNEIWGIHHSRPFLRKVTDYVAVLLLAPLVVTAALGMSITTSLHNIGIPTFGFDFDAVALKLAPYLVYWLFMTVFYIFMPNTRVSVRSALIAGFVAGMLLQLAQVFTVSGLTKLTANAAIYGAFVAIPIFMIWLQISWLIILFGAELCFAIQNVKTYEHESRMEGYTHADRELIALRLAVSIARRFDAGEAPATPEALAEEYELPIRLVNELTFMLEKQGILLRLEEPETALAPGKPLGKIHVTDVINAVTGLREKTRRGPAFRILEEMDEAAGAIGRNTSLSDLIRSNNPPPAEEAQ